MCTKCNQRHTSCGCRTLPANTCGLCRPMLITARSPERESECENRERDEQEERKGRHSEWKAAQNRCSRCGRPVLIAPSASCDCKVNGSIHNNSCCCGDF